MKKNETLLPLKYWGFTYKRWPMNEGNILFKDVFYRHPYFCIFKIRNLFSSGFRMGWSLEIWKIWKRIKKIKYRPKMHHQAYSYFDIFSFRLIHTPVHFFAKLGSYWVDNLFITFVNISSVRKYFLNMVA